MKIHGEIDFSAFKGVYNKNIYIDDIEFMNKVADDWMSGYLKDKVADAIVDPDSKIYNLDGWTDIGNPVLRNSDAVGTATFDVEVDFESDEAEMAAAEDLMTYEWDTILVTDGRDICKEFEFDVHFIRLDK